MANITFTIPSVLNQGGGEKKTEISADSLTNAFAKISESMGDDFKRRVLENDGKPRSLINIYINGKNAKFSDGMETVLKDGDEIYILPAVAGGSKELSSKELDRFSRQVMLEEIGYQGQLKLKNSRVCVVGTGGLGNPITSRLAAMGVGTLRIVDRDVIELSNLHRQTMFDEDDVGQVKVEVAAKKLQKLNPDCKIEALAVSVNDYTALEVIEGCDVVIDALDSVNARYALNKACVQSNIPFVTGAAVGVSGQALGQGANVIRLETPPGENATFDQVKEAFDNNNDVKAFYVVHNETSTGTMVNYLDKVSDLTSRNDSMYIVDSVSLLGGTSLPVDKWNIDVCMTGAQKAIAAPPGISPISISPKAKKYMIENPPATMYFNLARYFKYYEESKHTPFTPALPLLYAYREALSILLEEGLENVFNRHKTCSDALYAGLSALGLTPFAKEEDRSITIVALNYLDGLEDKTFRNTLAEKFRVLVAGGFGDLKGKVFRVGCMGEVQRYHVMRTISSIASTLDMMGYDVDAKAGLKIAEEKLKDL